MHRSSAQSIDNYLALIYPIYVFGRRHVAEDELIHISNESEGHIESSSTKVPSHWEGALADGVRLRTEQDMEQWYDFYFYFYFLSFYYVNEMRRKFAQNYAFENDTSKCNIINLQEN